MNFKDKLEAIRLAGLDNQEAIKWLEDNSLNERPGLLSEENRPRMVAEFLWHRRNNRELNLALARFGINIHVLKRLFLDRGKTQWEGIPHYSLRKPKKSDKLLKMSILANVFVGPEEGFILNDKSILSLDNFIEILNDFPRSKDLVQAYFNNPHIPRELLSKIIKKEGEFEFLSDDLLMHILFFLSENPILKSRRDPIILDGWASYQHSVLFKDLVDLLFEVPATQAWARVLTGIVQKIAEFPVWGDREFAPLVKRWQIETGQDPQLFSSFWLRYEIGKRLYESSDRKNKDIVGPGHDDQAIRFAYYNSCSPEDMFGYSIREENFYYPSFKSEDEENLSSSQKQVIEKCRGFIERDKNEFVEQVIENKNFWRCREDRQFLENIAWDLAEDKNSSMMVPNTRNFVEERIRKENPEFFKDDEFFKPEGSLKLDWEIELIQKSLDEINKKLEYESINETISHQKLLIDELLSRQEKYFQDIIFRTESSFENLQEEIVEIIQRNSLGYQLQEINMRLAEVTESAKKTQRLLWTILFLVLGIILFFR